MTPKLEAERIKLPPNLERSPYGPVNLFEKVRAFDADLYDYARGPGQAPRFTGDDIGEQIKQRIKPIFEYWSLVADACINAPGKEGVECNYEIETSPAEGSNDAQTRETWTIVHLGGEKMKLFTIRTEGSAPRVVINMTYENDKYKSWLLGIWYEGGEVWHPETGVTQKLSPDGKLLGVDYKIAFREGCISVTKDDKSRASFEREQVSVVRDTTDFHTITFNGDVLGEATVVATEAQS